MVTGIDQSDPLVVVLAWALTWAAGKWALPKQYRATLPAVAVLAAVAIRAALDAGMGEPLTVDSALRAAVAGAVAVAGHSQVRGMAKAAKRRGGARRGRRRASGGAGEE
jgi:uncharacterized protein (DUF2062 family)